jgi:hypothetical protein
MNAINAVFLFVIGTFTLKHLAAGEHVPFFYWVFVGYSIWQIVREASVAALKTRAENLEFVLGSKQKELDASNEQKSELMAENETLKLIAASKRKITSDITKTSP